MDGWGCASGRKERATLAAALWICHFTLLSYLTRTCQLTPQNTTKQTRRPPVCSLNASPLQRHERRAVPRTRRVMTASIRARNCGDWSTWLLLIFFFLMWRASWHHVQTMFPNTRHRVQVMVWRCVQAKPELSTCRVYLFWLSYSQSNYKRLPLWTRRAQVRPDDCSGASELQTAPPDLALRRFGDSALCRRGPATLCKCASRAKSAQTWQTSHLKSSIFCKNNFLKKCAFWATFSLSSLTDWKDIACVFSGVFST